MAVEASHFFLEGNREARPVSDELIGLDQVSLTGTPGLGAFVDDTAPSPIATRLWAHAMGGGRPGGEVACIDARVQSTVSETVRHRCSRSGAVFAAVAVRPFCTGIDEVVVGDEAADVADDFPAGHVHVPVDCTAVLAGFRMAVEGSTWLVLGLILGMWSVQLLNSLFNSAFPEYIIVRPNGAYRIRGLCAFTFQIGATNAPTKKR